MTTLPAIVLLPEDSQGTWREARLSSSALSGCSALAPNLPTQTQAAECELGWTARLPAPHTSLHNCHKLAYSNEEEGGADQSQTNMVNSVPLLHTSLHQVSLSMFILITGDCKLSPSNEEDAQRRSESVYRTVFL